MKESYESMIRKICVVLLAGGLWGLTWITTYFLPPGTNYSLKIVMLSMTCFFVTGAGMRFFPSAMMPAYLSLTAAVAVILPVIPGDVPAARFINTAMLAFLAGGFLAFLRWITGPDGNTSHVTRGLQAASAAILSSIASFYLGLNLCPTGHLMEFSRPGGILWFMLMETLPWTAAACIMLPFGWAAGDAVLKKTTGRITPPVMYTLVSLLVILMWTACVLIALGLFA